MRSGSRLIIHLSSWYLFLQVVFRLQYSSNSTEIAISRCNHMWVNRVIIIEVSMCMSRHPLFSFQFCALYILRVNLHFRDRIIIINILIRLRKIKQGKLHKCFSINHLPLSNKIKIIHNQWEKVSSNFLVRVYCPFWNFVYFVRCNKSMIHPLWNYRRDGYLIHSYLSAFSIMHRQSVD